MLRGPGGLEPLIFGSGQDGSVLLNVDGTLLTQEIYAEDVTISGLINPGGVRIFARDFIDITNTGGLLASGQDAVAQQGGFTRWVNGILSGGEGGGSGATGAVGGVGVDVTISVGGRGGDGGSSSTNAGGVAGSITGLTLNSEYNILCPLMGALAWDGTTPLARLNPGTSAGAGGNRLAGFGGGGGAPGGIVILAAPEITIDGGIIYASGGLGANGVDGGAGSDSGGGGGGGGGTVMLVYGKFNLIGGGQILVNGGDGGNGTNAGAFGGQGGGPGIIIHYTNGYLATRTEFGSFGANGTP